MYYTIGQIHKLGLLKSWNGKPYKNKSSISRIVNNEEFKVVRTPHGEAKALNDKQIKVLNKMRVFTDDEIKISEKMSKEFVKGLNDNMS